MQYRHGHAEVMAEGFGETHQFAIAASGKAFKSLIDGLYSRKIEAAMRELATNAFDAHIAAGVILPFDVHLPTVLSPVFSIRDYGTGMSHEMVTRRYTTLFDSTKDGLQNGTEDHQTPANKQVGMLGLGSKSFFAYTDSCSITVWMDGEVRHYAVYMGANGVPSISLAARHASDEPRGVKVEFAVKKKDMDEFRRAAIRVFKGFPLMPNGLPMDVTEALGEKPTHVGSFWKAYGASYLPDGGFYAKQGCVLYPIDLSLVSAATLDEDDEDFVSPDDEAKRFKGVPKELHPSRVQMFKDLAASLTIVIDFPIGSLEFDISRERLAYTDDTVRALRDHWVRFVKSLDRSFDQTFTKCKTPWEKMQTAKGPLFDGLGVLFTRTNYSWESESLLGTLEGMFQKDRSGRGSYPFSYIVKRVEGGSYWDTSVFYNWKAARCPKKESFAKAAVIQIDADEKKRVRMQRKLIQNWLNQQDKFEVAFILDEFKFTPEAHEKMGFPPIVKLSELPELPKEDKPRRTGNNGGGGRYHRIKIIEPGGNAYDGATSDAQYAGHLFAFMNCYKVWNPDYERYPHFDVGEVMLTHRLLNRTSGGSISFINIKKNEDLSQWDDMPLFYGCLDDIATKMSREDVRQFIACLNWKRFEGSGLYYGIQNMKFGKKERNPLAHLLRFDRRYQALSHEDRSLWNAFLYADFLQPLIGAVIDRAVEFGIEVLPPRVEHKNAFGHWVEWDEFTAPIVPEKWHKVASVCRNLTSISNKPFVHSLLKAYASC